MSALCRPRRLMPLLLVSLVPACTATVPASLLLTVTRGPDAPPASALRVRVFDEQGRAHPDAAFAAPPPGADGRMGTLVIYPRPGGSLSLRVQVQGLGDGPDPALVSEGTVAVALTAGRQQTASLTLRGPSRGPDRDGDEIPDEIDNCPAAPNPDQADVAGDGVADDCPLVVDAGAEAGPDAGAEAGFDAGFDGPDGDGPTGSPTGARCSAAADCANGSCVDGVCCETACDQACRACNLLGAEGRCAPVGAGQADPRQRCPADGAESCGLDGTCNGAGACRKHRAGTVCGVASCASAVERVLPALCDGLGTCLASRTQSCAPFRCGEAECQTSCSGPQDCAAGASCVNGSCGRKALGAPCLSGSDCNSNQCVDGVCCEVASCTGPCQACNLTGAEGSCRPLPANAEPRADGCALQAASSCGRTGKCDGSGACQLYPAGTMCAARSCSGSLQVAAGSCNGGGTCQPGVNQSCGAYACLADACATSCTADAHCAVGHYCGGRNLCRVREANGALCGESRECLGGFCVLGRCCSSATCL